MKQTTTTTTTTTMKRLLSIAVLCLLFPCSVSSLITPKASASATKARKILPPLRSGAITTGTTSTSTDEDVDVAVQDFRPQASALFANIRIPAALFAGASAGAAFAMPLVGMSDGLKLGLVKRLYALLLLGALSSQILAVVVSTLTVGALGASAHYDDTPPMTKSVSELLRTRYDLEWVTVRLHFFTGILCFIVGIGLRAWVTIGCPVIAKAALGLILSATVLCLAFMQEMEVNEASSSSSSSGSFLEGVVQLPFRYVMLLMRRASRKPLFAAALALSTTTFGYILYKIPHIMKWLLVSSK
jgi:hypothetical protein